MLSFRLYLYSLLVRWLPESRFFSFKNLLLRFAGAKIGRNVRIYSSARIFGNGRLEIGDDVHIGPEVMLYSVAPAGIEIGSAVDIGPRVMVLTGSHRIDVNGRHMAGTGTASVVAIGDGYWLGAGAMILPGIKLPRKTVVAAGAVVDRPFVAERTLLAGNPAELKKKYQ